MQDRYAGDIGDFSKLGLLRSLAGDDLRVGILWWRTADETNGDGGTRATAYLHDPVLRLRPCDPMLFDTLRGIVQTGNRTVAALTSASFARSWTGHAEFVPTAAARSAWLDRGVASVADADSICLDPDNGLLPHPPRRGAKLEKYVLAEELQRVASTGKVIVLYQHLTRRGTAD